jgi:hypothetical protein
MLGMNWQNPPKNLIVISINTTKRIYCGKCKWHSKHLEKSFSDKIMSDLILVLQQIGERFPSL